MPLIVEYRESIQYDGTNSDYICGTFANVVNLGEDENGLLISGNDNDNVYVTPGMWITKSRKYPTWISACTNEMYLEQYRELP